MFRSIGVLVNSSLVIFVFYEVTDVGADWGIKILFELDSMQFHVLDYIVSFLPNMPIVGASLI